MKYMGTTYLITVLKFGVQFAEEMVQAVAVGTLQRKTRFAARGIILLHQDSSMALFSSFSQGIFFY